MFAYLAIAVFYLLALAASANAQPRNIPAPGIGSCPNGQAVVRLNQNSPPTCGTFYNSLCAGTVTLTTNPQTVTNGCIGANLPIICTANEANPVGCSLPLSAGSFTVFGTIGDVISWTQGAGQGASALFPINNLPAQTGDYNAQSFKITNIGELDLIGGSVASSTSNSLPLGALLWSPYLIDSTSWNVSSAHYSLVMGSSAGGGVGSDNQFGLTLQETSPVTSSLASYERAAGLFWARTADPSTTLISRGMVGLDTRGEIAAGNTAGEVWGADVIAAADSGSDGNLWTLEVDVDNGGADSPNNDVGPGTAGTKIGIGIVGGEFRNVTGGGAGNPITDAISLELAGAHNGIFANPTSGPTGWALIHDQASNGNDVFSVDGATGTVSINQASITGPLYYANGNAVCNHTNALCHEVVGQATTNSAGTATVSLSGAAAYTNGVAFCTCTAANVAVLEDGARCVLNNRTTITIQLNNAVADTVTYRCVGS